VAELAVDRKTLDLLNFVRVEAIDEVSNFELLGLVKTLKEENTSHTWHNLSEVNMENVFSKVVAFESVRRPTDLFFYHGVRRDGGKELIGVGTVARKISHSFQIEGFPVIARCFVKPKFRNYRLYMPILKHRFDHCRKIFGTQLKGIHLGSQNPRIYSVVKKSIFDLPFFYIGDELLDLKGDSAVVRDYLYLTASFQDIVREEIRQIADLSRSKLLSECFDALVNNKFKASSYAEMYSLVYKENGPRAIIGCHNLYDMIDLFGAIGVLRDSFRSDDVVPDVGSRSRVA
jgi:hypothetical protein